MTSRSRCCADDCTNCRFRCSKFTFHPFPKDPALRKQWLAAMGKSDWVPPPHTILCSAHFTEDSFQEILGHNCLKIWAVPSIFRSPANKSVVKAFIGKPSPVRPKGILKRKGSPRNLSVDATPLKVKSDQYLFSKKTKSFNESEADVVDIMEETEENPDDVEMIHIAARSVGKPSKSLPKDISQGNSFLSEYLIKRNACVQTENVYITKTANTQTVTSVPNHDDDLGDSSQLMCTVESLRSKLERLQGHIHLLENNLRQKEEEVNTLVNERNELSSRLNEETMSVVVDSFKEVLKEFLNDDHSSMEKFLTESGQLCLNTNISFVRSSGNSLGEQD